MGSWRIFELARKPRMFPDAEPGQLVSYWAGVNPDLVRAYETFQVDSITVYARRVADVDGVQIVAMRADGRVLEAIGSRIAYDIERAVARLLADGTVVLHEVAYISGVTSIPVVVNFREDEYSQSYVVRQPIDSSIAWGEHAEASGPGSTFTRLAHIEDVRCACPNCGSLNRLVNSERGNCDVCDLPVIKQIATALEIDIPF